MASARRGLVPLLLVAWHCATSARVMTLSLADDLANSALKEARERDLKPVTITVVDEAGRVIVSKREDACGNTIPDFALAKSRSCVGMGMSTRALRDKYAEKPTQLACMATISPLAPFPGGVLLRGADGERPRRRRRRAARRPWVPRGTIRRHVHHLLTALLRALLKLHHDDPLPA